MKTLHTHPTRTKANTKSTKAELKPKTNGATDTNPEAPSNVVAFANEHQLKTLLDEMNAEHGVISVNGQTRVVSFDDGKVVLQRVSDFRDFYCNKKIQIGDKQTPVAKLWLEHPSRRTYTGFAFSPASPLVVGDKLNLWRGWGVEPTPGQWPLMKAHIETVLAAGNPESAEYIIKWAAWAVQNPADRAEAVLVLMGGEGNGKGVFLNGLCKIFGKHAKHISSMEQLTGKHNAHIRDCAFMYADEAYWAGSKSGLGPLKRLITEPTLFIEPKFIDADEVPNRIKLALSSNEAWVVPASNDARRFAVFRLSEEKRQNKEYFAALFAERDEQGGLAAMLYDLLKMDLKDWHPRQIVHTEALLDQKQHSLSPADACLLVLLEEGTLPAVHDPKIPNEVRSRGDNHKEGIYEFMRNATPELRNATEHRLGRILKTWGCENRRWKNVNGWRFPSLKKMRADWEARFVSDARWKWPEGPEEWEAASVEGESM